MRRLPPNKIEQNLNGLLNLIPEETDELLQRVDQPLKEDTDPETGRKFLLCDYNRDGDSYRYRQNQKLKPLLFCVLSFICCIYARSADPPGPTHIPLLLMMGFCLPRSSVVWKSSSTSCSMPTARCISKAVPLLSISGTKTKDSLAAS